MYVDDGNRVGTIWSQFACCTFTQTLDVLLRTWGVVLKSTSTCYWSIAGRLQRRHDHMELDTTQVC